MEGGGAVGSGVRRSPGDGGIQSRDMEGRPHCLTMLGFKVSSMKWRAVTERFPGFFLSLTGHAYGCLEEGERLGGWILLVWTGDRTPSNGRVRSNCHGVSPVGRWSEWMGICESCSKLWSTTCWKYSHLSKNRRKRKSHFILEFYLWLVLQLSKL